jgi:hypothetical protein
MKGGGAGFNLHYGQYHADPHCRSAAKMAAKVKTRFPNPIMMHSTHGRIAR